MCGITQEYYDNLSEKDKQYYQVYEDGSLIKDELCLSCVYALQEEQDLEYRRNQERWNDYFEHERRAGRL